jgi:hypothetical protein
MTDVLEVNVLTGERIERDFTPAELEQRATDAAAAEAAQAQAEAAAAVKAAARTALLERLGISEDEAALLREAGI